MSNLEHYFENFLFYGKDLTGEPNKNALSKEQQEAVETCANYIIFVIFCGREDLIKYARRDQDPGEDLIYRQAAIDSIWDGTNMDIYTSEVKEILENLPSFQPEAKTKWIPVSERLPEESLNSVIGWDAYRERPVFIQYLEGHFCNMGSNESFDIRAWMPNPEPYKAESEEGQ